MAPVSRYASHYLRLGAYRCTYPLLSLCGDGRVELESFTQEVAGTVFVSGEMSLVCDELPLLPRYEDISIEQAQEVVSRYSGWALALPM